MQGIAPELHSFLVSQIKDEVYADRSMLPLTSLPAVFLQSCTQCATFFARVQQQVPSCLLRTLLLLARSSAKLD